MTEKFYSTGQVAKILNIKPHQIAYAISNGSVEEPKMTFLGKRAFLENDIERLKEHFNQTRKENNDE